ncbi:uncharacterized protein LOC128883510 [Hylaeus volcanicus]|uniref:uncharacterized protein LOC128883510 n=1 Tax=Hylaeus volcanicus TaxID=313075 RepID=UPI0023B879EC|nr:uncharacterized protein LOC128883510 [Hylaeus volcanicus]
MYSIEVQKATCSNRTGVMRRATFKNELISNLSNNELKTCWDIFLMGWGKNPDGNCLGRRVKNENGVLGEYQWLTYDQVKKNALKFGSAVLDLQLVKATTAPDEFYPNARTMRFLSVCSTNCMECFICEQAANAYGLTLLPLYDTFGIEALQYIVNEAEITSTCCSAKCIPTLLAVAEKCPLLTTFVVFDSISTELEEKIKKQNITIHSFSTLMSWENLRTVSPGQSGDISTLCYTSGSTGKPKGVLLAQSNYIAFVSSVLRGIIDCPGGFHASSSDVHISYLPLAHVFERSICSLIISLGASIGVYSGDVTKLIDDMQVLKPTIFISVPRLFVRIIDKIAMNVRTKSSFAQYMFQTATNQKLKRLHTSADTRHAFWDTFIFKKTVQLMGGNLRFMLVGGAPIESNVRDLVSVYFSAPLLEGYGLTESLGSSFVASMDDPLSGHVGCPVPGIEFCLLNAEEMRYTVDSFPPAGEILLRGPIIFKGYYKNAKETQAVLDSDGWFHTSDIGVLLPNGALKIIDRRKNIFKLSQGEYIIPERIEAILTGSRFVSQIFVYGYSTKSFIIAIIVPDTAAVDEWQTAQGDTKLSMEDACKTKSLHLAVKNDLEIIGNKGGLKGFEKIKKFYLHPTQFTVENGLLTPTLKFKRNIIKDQFTSIIDQLYEEQN